MKEVVIVSAVRTPMGSFGGVLSSVSATNLGSIAIKGAIEKAGISPKDIQEVFMGNVLQSNLGHFAKGRNGQKLGDMKLIDGLVKDGLTDVYNKIHMGNCAEICAKDMNFTREQQDDYAIESYKRSHQSWKEGRFNNEIIPVIVSQRRGDDLIVSEDEEYNNVKIEKIPKLRPVFEKDGTITAANASTLNDGASALVLMSLEKSKELGVIPLAKIKGYADAAHEPEWFTTAPSKAIPKALIKANLDISDVDYFELNEAFSVVGLANTKILGLNSEKVNVNGGAVSLGHPLGSSGSRIIVTLINVLKQNNSKIGAAGICNGGGGASAMVIELI